MQELWSRIRLFAVVLLLSAAHHAAAGDAPPPIGTVSPQHFFAGVYVTGQPLPGDLAAAKQAGVKTVINLRTPGEQKAFDEAKTATDLGLGYVNPAFLKPDALTDEMLDRVRALLSDPAKQPVLLHCGSASRASAVWLAHRVLDNGVPYDTALTEAKSAGLSTPPLEARVKRYIDSHRAAGSPSGAQP